MNGPGRKSKSDLVNAIASRAKISKAAAEKAINVIIDSVRERLKKNEKVTLVGFGTFSVAKRKARTGRNPQTGKTIKIPARKVPKFSAGKALKNKIK